MLPGGTEPKEGDLRRNYRMTKRAPRKGEGRPSIFTQELGDKICEQLALGISMRTVCLAEEMPSIATVFSWIRTKPEFQAQYARAKEESADAMAEDILDIADDGTNDWVTITLPGGYEKEVPDHEVLQRSRLRVDTRKWIMSKMKPKKYGEKLDVTTDNKPITFVLANEIGQKHKIANESTPDTSNGS
jgi:hypothetical protein